MDGYAIISLREMIHQIGENRVMTTRKTGGMKEP